MADSTGCAGGIYTPVLSPQIGVPGSDRNRGPLPNFPSMRYSRGMNKTCGVNIYGPRAQYHCCEHGCEDCRVGCFNPARHKNPFFDKGFCSEKHWWRSTYSYTEYL